MNPTTILSIVMLLVGGGLGIAGTTAVTQLSVVQPCANDIAKGQANSCPKPIKTAYAAAQLAAAKTALAQRDVTMPVLAHAQTEGRARSQELQAEVSALNEQDRTHACADSPAMRLRREQLCQSAGGPDCVKPDEVPR